MATVNWRPDGPPLYALMTEDDGTPYDMTGASLWLSIQAAAACVIVTGDPLDSRMGLMAFDLTDAPLIPRAYRATAHVRWTDGREEAVEPDFVLHIEGGC